MINLLKCLQGIKNYFIDVGINVNNSEFSEEGLIVELNIQNKKVEDKKLLLRIDVLKTGFASFRFIGGQIQKNLDTFEAVNDFNNVSLLTCCIDEKGYIQFQYNTFCQKIRDVIQFMDLALNDIVSDEVVPALKKVLDLTNY